jgi:hypothetical protein
MTFARIREAATVAETIAAEHRAAGKRVVWTLGFDIPRELVDAYGLAPVRLVPGTHDRGAIDALVSRENMSERGQALLAAIAAIPPSDALLISHADADQPQIFATLREFGRCGVLQLPSVAFLDLLVIDREPTRRYNAVRLEQAKAWLRGLGGEPDFDGALRTGEAIRAELRALNALRPRLSGSEAHALFAAAATLAPVELLDLLPALRREVEAREPVEGRRILLSGTEVETLDVIDAIEAEHGVVIGEDHGWGETRLGPIGDLAQWTLSPSAGPFASSQKRAERLAMRIAADAPDGVVHYQGPGVQSALWEAEAIRSALPADMDLIVTPPPAPPPPPALRGPRPAAPQRSRKSLGVIARFGAYQRAGGGRRYLRRGRCQCAAGDAAGAGRPVRGQPMVGGDRRSQAAKRALFGPAGRGRPA